MQLITDAGASEEFWEHFFCKQELKKAILEDLVCLGKASCLHSFEQVGMLS